MIRGVDRNLKDSNLLYHLLLILIISRFCCLVNIEFSCSLNDTRISVVPTVKRELQAEVSLGSVR